MLRRGSHVALACSFVVFAATRAHADADISAITAALGNSDYPAAQDLVTKALAIGGNSPDSTLELYRLQGVIEGSLGNAQRATDAFLRALALDPKLSLATGTSPKVMRPFEAAQSFYKTNPPLKVKVETQSTPPAITLVVQSDPMKMVARARVALVVDGKPEQMLDGVGTIKLPAGSRLDLRVAVLDAQGNRLVEIGSTDVPIVIVSSTTAPQAPKKPVTKPTRGSEPVRERPLYLAWWLWGGAAVAFAGAGVGVGVSAMQARDDLEQLNATSTAHTFDEATATEDKIRTRLLLANISYGVAIGLGLGAAILFVTKPSAAERATISVAPTQGGGAIVLGGTF